jgi:hypothetical protein
MAKKVHNPTFYPPKFVTPNQAAKILIMAQLSDWGHIWEYAEEYGLSEGQVTEIIAHYRKHVDSLAKRIKVDSITAKLM